MQSFLNTFFVGAAGLEDAGGTDAEGVTREAETVCGQVLDTVDVAGHILKCGLNIGVVKERRISTPFLGPVGGDGLMRFQAKTLSPLFDPLNGLG